MNDCTYPIGSNDCAGLATGVTVVSFRAMSGEPIALALHLVILFLALIILVYQVRRSGIAKRWMTFARVVIQNIRK